MKNDSELFRPNREQDGPEQSGFRSRENTGHPGHLTPQWWLILLCNFTDMCPAAAMWRLGENNTKVLPILSSN
jgi:hypothetical protein